MKKKLLVLILLVVVLTVVLAACDGDVNTPAYWIKEKCYSNRNCDMKLISETEVPYEGRTLVTAIYSYSWSSSLYGHDSDFVRIEYYKRGNKVYKEDVVSINKLNVKYYY